MAVSWDFGPAAPEALALQELRMATSREVHRPPPSHNVWPASSRRSAPGPAVWGRALITAPSTSDDLNMLPRPHSRSPALGKWKIALITY